MSDFEFSFDLLTDTPETTIGCCAGALAMMLALHHDLDEGQVLMVKQATALLEQVDFEILASDDEVET